MRPAAQRRTSDPHPREKHRCPLSSIPNCPDCGSEDAYQDGASYVCPMCAHEWPMDAADDDELVVRDVHGNVLSDGDTVAVIKDLKVKGTSSVVKVGTKVRNIRLCEGEDNIDCKVEGIGAMSLKSEFVKKV
jgi:protein PhnA